MNMNLSKKYCLFPSSKNRIEKNFKLAYDSITSLDNNIEIVTLGQNYSTEEVNLLYNACDFLLLTSIREGSPQSIKEALACNCPIISTNVGDVKKMLGNTQNCFIVPFDKFEIQKKIKIILESQSRSNGRIKSKDYSNSILLIN